jgi:hypothetical protein
MSPAASFATPSFSLQEPMPRIALFSLAATRWGLSVHLRVDTTYEGRPKGLHYF